MSRQKSPNRDKAFEIYKENGGNVENRVEFIHSVSF
ncbi:phage terminase small subunit-related protein [Clostridium sp. LBM24168]